MPSTSSRLFTMIALLLAIIASTPTAFAQNPGITSPSPGQVVNGVVLVSGTADDASFLRYELAFLREADSSSGWIVFADGNQAVVNGTLAVWDTTVGQNVNAPVFPDGQYQLRLRIVRQDFNYDEFFVTNLTIANAQAVEQPTATPEPIATPIPELPTPEPNLVTPTAVITATPTTVPTPTPLVSREAPTLVATLESAPTLEQPAQLPTLTPFPSPTALSTAEAGGFTGIIQDVEPEDAVTLLETVAEYDYSQFGQSFRNGFLWPFYIFGAVAVYMLIRGGVRWLWKFISSSF